MKTHFNGMFNQPIGKLKTKSLGDPQIKFALRVTVVDRFVFFVSLLLLEKPLAKEESSNFGLRVHGQNNLTCFLK